MIEQLDLQFLNSRNGQSTCSADGRYLHSSFNPENEAQRFIDSVNCPFEPSAVILLGACLPWCAVPLKKRFPKAKLIAVQYDARFESNSLSWDNTFFVTDAQEAALFSNTLFNLLGEEKLMTAQFLSWKPSETVWPESFRLSWEAIKSCMEKAQSVLTTRNHFNKAWFRNTVSNLSRIKTYAVPEKTDLPIIVTASGPSLTNAIPFIRANRKHFRLMAASSSISTLIANDIIPDYAISTDGGWYATRHLRSYLTDERLKDVPLIISGESAVPQTLTDKVPFIVLTYGDGIETVLAEQVGVPSIHGLRNGTVSGTAAALAFQLTSGPVYMCGLDLAPGKGFQHAEPNENDVPLFTGQSRLHTLETAQSSSRYAGGSLAIYRDWFSNQGPEFTSRIFRLVSEKDKLEPLGTMKDISLETLHFTKSAGSSPSFRTQKASLRVASDIKKYFEQVIEYIQQNPADEKCSLWYASLSLEKYINWLRMNKESQENELFVLSDSTVKQLRSFAVNV